VVTVITRNQGKRYANDINGFCSFCNLVGFAAHDDSGRRQGFGGDASTLFRHSL